MLVTLYADRGVDLEALPPVCTAMGLTNFKDVSVQNEATDSGFAMFEVEVTAEELTTLQANADVHIVDPSRWAANNYTPLKDFVVGKGKTRAQLVSDKQKLNHASCKTALQGAIDLLGATILFEDNFNGVDGTKAGQGTPDNNGTLGPWIGSEGFVGRTPYIYGGLATCFTGSNANECLFLNPGTDPVFTVVVDITYDVTNYPYFVVEANHENITGSANTAGTYGFYFRNKNPEEGLWLRQNNNNTQEALVKVTNLHTLYPLGDAGYVERFYLVFGSGYIAAYGPDKQLISQQSITVSGVETYLRFRMTTNLQGAGVSRIAIYDTVDVTAIS